MALTILETLTTLSKTLLSSAATTIRRKAKSAACGMWH